MWSLCVSGVHRPPLRGAEHEPTTAPNQSASFKAKLALAALNGDRTVRSWADSSMFGPTRSLSEALATRRTACRVHSRRSGTAAVVP